MRFVQALTASAMPEGSVALPYQASSAQEEGGDAADKAILCSFVCSFREGGG